MGACFRCGKMGHKILVVHMLKGKERVLVFKLLLRATSVDGTARGFVWPVRVHVLGVVKRVIS